jgi:heterodisulfide reductase subunit B
MATQINTDLADRIRASTGENVYLCYHCVKCTSGCPLVTHFDIAPNQVMRAAQLGMEDLIFESKTPWMCASCQTCTTRCPQGIDIARVMDFIVGEAMESGIEARVPDVALFNKVFLRNVDILGRAYELGLIAEMNVRTGHLFNNIDLGFELIKKRKVRFLPEVVHKRKRRAPMAPASRPSSEVGYYPGCSLHSMAGEFDHSARSAMEHVGLVPVEPDGWVCCGSTPAHRVDHKMATRLPLESLVLFEEEGLGEIALPCASCYSRFRAAAREIRLDPQLKKDVEAEIGREYHDSVKITSLLDLFVERVGLEEIRNRVVRPLNGLKVACYYGCLLTRPPDVTGSTEPEYPMSMDRLVEALGGTPVPWDSKVACCGASLSATHLDIVLDLSGNILSNARRRGADIVLVACPLCHLNLDGRQTQMDRTDPVPVLYFTQLMALAFGDLDGAALNKNLIDPRPLFRETGLL